MPTVTRRFTSITELDDFNPAEATQSWTNVGGGASFAESVGSTSGASKYLRSGTLIDSGSQYSKLLQLTSPDKAVPLFADITGVSFSYQAMCENEMLILGNQVSDPIHHRAWNADRGDSWTLAGSGTSNGLRTATASNVSSAIRSGFTRSTWQASGVSGYLGGGSKAYRLNSGWTHRIGFYNDTGGEDYLRLDSVTEVITYTAPAAPGAFTLSSPSNSATGVSLTPTLTWGDAARAVRYRVRVSVNSDMSSPVVDVTTDAITMETSTAPATYSVTTPLAAGTLYYWRVDAINYAAEDNTSQQTTACTADRSFTTASGGGGGARTRARRRSRSTDPASYT